MPVVRLVIVVVLVLYEDRPRVGGVQLAGGAVEPVGFGFDLAVTVTAHGDVAHAGGHRSSSSVAWRRFDHSVWAYWASIRRCSARICASWARRRMLAWVSGSRRRA